MSKENVTFATIKSIAENAPDYSLDQLKIDLGVGGGDVYLTTAEAAEYLRVSTRTIIYIRDQRKLQAYKVLNSVRYKKADLDKFIQKYTRCNQGRKPKPVKV